MYKLCIVGSWIVGLCIVNQHKLFATEKAITVFTAAPFESKVSKNLFILLSKEPSINGSLLRMTWQYGDIVLTELSVSL